MNNNPNRAPGQNNNQWNTNENQQNKQKNNLWQLSKEFLKDFFNSKSESNFQAFYNDIAIIFNQNNANNQIPDKIKKELNQYKNSNSYYFEIDVNKINFDFLFYRLMESGWFEIENRYKTINEIINNLYEITEKQDEITIAIKNLSSSQTQKIINSESERDSFLKTIFKNKIPNKKPIKSIFEWIEWVDSDKLTKEQKEALLDLQVNWFNENNRKALVSIINTFNTKQKKDIIKTFIPVLTLEEIKDLWINVHTNEIVNNLKNSHFEIFKAKIEDQNKAKIDELKLQIDNLDLSNKDILISTSELFDTYSNITEKTINSIIGKKIENIFGEVNKQAETREKDDRMKLFENISKGTYWNISWINNFSISDQAQNVVLEWKIIDDNDKEKKIYLQINSFKPEWIEVMERTHSHWIVEEKSCELKMISYGELSTMLNYFNDPQNTKANCVVYKKETIEKSVEEHKIKEFKWENNIVEIGDLQNLIDVIDEKWKHIKLAERMVFSFDDWSDKNSDDDSVGIWVITKIDKDWKKIQIDSQWPQVVLSFTEFLTTFKNLKCKRLVNITNFQSAFDHIKNHEDTKKWFENVIYKESENKILPKNQEKNSKHPWVEYFVNKDKKAIKINKIKDNCVEVEVWEMEENFKKEKGKDWEEKSKINKTFKVKSKSSMSLHVFYWYLTQHKLLPEINKDLIEITDKPKDKKLDESYSPAKTLFGMQNWITITAWFKQYMDSVKQTLKDNNDLQAAEFAMKMWKILPLWDTIKEELQSKVEWIMKKKMNEKVEKLTNWMDAGVSMKHVKKILKTSNPYQHEIEAVLFYVLKKNWTLYPTELKDYKWSFMWYKKLGGSLNDEVYTSYAKECIAESKTMTEEELISKLFAKQKDINSSYYPKRRTTIVGEFSRAWWDWRNEAISSWEKDMESVTTFDTRKKIVIDKLKDWQDMYAVWVMKKMYDKWWNISERNLMPFIIWTTWISKWWHETVWTALAKISSDHQVPAMNFMSKPENVDFYNKATLNFAKQISKGAYEELRDLQLEVGKTDNKKLIWKLEDYWNKYWSELAVKLTGNDFDTFLQSQKDTDNYNSITKEYFDTVKSVATKNKATNDNKLNDVYTADSAFLLFAWWSDYLKTMLWNLTNNWFNNSGDTSATTIKSVLKKLDDIKNYKWLKNEKLTTDQIKDRKKRLFVELNKIIVLYCYSWTDLKKFAETEFYQELRNRWLWLPKKNEDDKFEKFLTSEINSPSFETKFERAFDNFNDEKFKNTIENEKKNVVLKINDILNLSKKPFSGKKKWKKKKEEEFDEYDEFDSAAA